MTSAPTEDGWVPADTLAARLVLVRRQLGLSQRAAADQCGLTFGEWQSIEDGRSARGLDVKIARISLALGVNRAWLAWGGPLMTSQADDTELRQAKRAIRANGQSSTRCTHSLGQRRAAKVLRSSWLNRPAHSARPSAA